MESIREEVLLDLRCRWGSALSAWSGLNPVDFMKARKQKAEALALVGKLLREDANLDRQGADALEAIIHTAYKQLRKS